MCHYRGSYVSEDRAKAEADRQRELEAKRTQAVDKLKQETDTAAQRAVSTPAKEPVPAKQLDLHSGDHCIYDAPPRRGIPHPRRDIAAQQHRWKSLNENSAP